MSNGLGLCDGGDKKYKCSNLVQMIVESRNIENMHQSHAFAKPLLGDAFLRSN
jgi:hypothetical protein